jgi:rhamnosyltransferase
VAGVIGLCKVAVIIPTLNGGERFQQLLVSLSSQTFSLCRRIVIDSQSNDDTVGRAKQFGWEVVSISPDEFNHGLTRQQGVAMVEDEVDVVVFLTQDAVLVDETAVSRLVACFDDGGLRQAAAASRSRTAGGICAVV